MDQGLGSENPRLLRFDAVLEALVWGFKIVDGSLASGCRGRRRVSGSSRRGDCCRCLVLFCLGRRRLGFLSSGPPPTLHFERFESGTIEEHFGLADGPMKPGRRAGGNPGFVALPIASPRYLVASAAATGRQLARRKEALVKPFDGVPTRESHLLGENGLMDAGWNAADRSPSSGRPCRPRPPSVEGVYI
jgi:hypothetical protein